MKRTILIAAIGLAALAAFFLAIQRIRKPTTSGPPPQVLEMVRGGALSASEPGPVSGEFRHEMAILEDRLEKDPADTEALQRSAVLLQDAHQPAEAVARYRRLLEIEPRNRQAWLDLANVAAETGDWTAALDASRGLLDHYPDDPEGLWNLGAIHANQGRMDEARAAWERASAQTADPAIAAKAVEALQRIAHAEP